MAIESVLAADLLMNLSVLFCVQLGLGRLRIAALGRALALLCADTLIGCLLHPPWWNSFIVQGPVCILCGMLVCGSRRPKICLLCASAVFCATTAAAGFANLAASPLPVAAVAPAALGFLLYRRRNPAVQWNIEIRIEKNGIEESLTALIDTGNRLKEHKSGLPVLIAERDAIPRLSALLDELDGNEVRTLGFGVLGSAGEMECFSPDKISIPDASGGVRRGPDCWIGIFDGRIPGPTRALAPPEFAEYAATGGLTAAENIRRKPHANFKRKTIHLRLRGAVQARLRLLHRRQ